MVKDFQKKHNQFTRKAFLVMTYLFTRVTHPTPYLSPYAAVFLSQHTLFFFCLKKSWVILPFYVTELSQRFRVLLLVMLKPRVSLPTDAVSWGDGKGTKRRMATAAPNINKEIIKGINRFLIRDFFSDDVSVLLS